MNKELKPCPFCGGKAQLDHDLTYSYVRCMECHARTKKIAIASYHVRDPEKIPRSDSGYMLCFNVDRSDDKAIELWNHRAGEES